MHIVLGLIGLLAAAGFWIYRIRDAARGAQELGELAGEAANLPRKMRFQHKARKKALEVIDDPREAAAVLMLGVARGQGEITVEQKRAISAQIQQNFELDAESADELLARAGWISSDIKDPQTLVRKMIDFIRIRLGEAELRQLDQMLREIANIDGEPHPAQLEFIAACRSRSGLR